MNTIEPTTFNEELVFYPRHIVKLKANGELGMDETFYINSGLQETAQENILHCFAFGESLWNCNWKLEKEYSRYISFNFILEGKLIIKTKDSEFVASQGDLLIARRIPLTMETPSKSKVKKYCLLLSNTLIQSAICDLLAPCDPSVIKLSMPEKISSLLEKIGNTIKNNPSKTTLELLLFEFLQEIRQQRTLTNKFPSTLETALSIIRKRAYKISRCELSEQCNVSLRTLTRMFSQYLNTSPSQYIIKCRLEKAASMLSFSNEPIKNIADECGFSSPMFFAREFKQHYNCTPKEFKKKHLKNAKIFTEQS